MQNCQCRKLRGVILSTCSREVCEKFHKPGTKKFPADYYFIGRVIFNYNDREKFSITRVLLQTINTCHPYQYCY